MSRHNQLLIASERNQKQSQLLDGMRTLQKQRVCFNSLGRHCFHRLAKKLPSASLKSLNIYVVVKKNLAVCSVAKGQILLCVLLLYI